MAKLGIRGLMAKKSSGGKQYAIRAVLARCMQHEVSMAQDIFTPNGLGINPAVGC